MKNKIKINIIYAMALSVLCIFIICPNVYAAEADIHYGSEEYNHNYNESFRIGIYLESESRIGDYLVELSYDEHYVTYVRGADDGGGGKITLSGNAAGADRKYLVEFRAVAGGNTHITVNSAKIYDESGAELNVSALPAAPISITPVSNALLSDLTMGGVSLEGFAPDKLSYEVSVPYETESLGLLPIGNNVDIETSDTTLTEGQNIIYLTVKNQSGQANVYTVYANREAEPKEQTEEGTNGSGADGSEGNGGGANGSGGDGSAGNGNAADENANMADLSGVNGDSSEGSSNSAVGGGKASDPILTFLIKILAVDLAVMLLIILSAIIRRKRKKRNTQGKEGEKEKAVSRSTRSTKSEKPAEGQKKAKGQQKTGSSAKAKSAKGNIKNNAKNNSENSSKGSDRNKAKSNPKGSNKGKAKNAAKNGYKGKVENGFEKYGGLKDISIVDVDEENEILTEKSFGKIVVSQNTEKPSEIPTEKMSDKSLHEENSNEAVINNDSELPVVISVQDVSMEFKVSTQNVSGIKEYIIKKLKGEMSYRQFKALSHVSFDVYKGEVVGIIGTNGSGKSTLLKIVSGALKPTSGRIKADRKKIQLLTLGTGFDAELTAKENVYLNGAIIGYTKEFIDANYDSIVEFAELKDFMEEKVKNFSSGMVSRLGFAIATAGEAAEILILDEVLSVGDEFFRKKSLARIKEMIHGGSTVLIVSHSMGTILEHCTKAVWIEKGELKMVGEPKTVCAEYRKKGV